MTVAKVIEMFRSVSGDVETRTVDYLVREVGDEEKAMQLCYDAVPFRMVSNPYFILSDISVKEIDKKSFLPDQILQDGLQPVGGVADGSVDDGWYMCTCTYTNETIPNAKPTPPEPDTEPGPPDLADPDNRLKKHTFNQSLAEVQEFTNMVGTTTYYVDASGEPEPFPAEDIMVRGINPSGEQGEFQGTQVKRPIGSFVITYYPSVAAADEAYLKLVKDAVGEVNSNTFYGYAPGEVLFVSCQGKGINDNRMELQLTFEVRKNLTNQFVLNLDGEAITYDVDGWDYAWVLYEPVENGGVVKQDPKAVIVEEIYPRGNMDDLFVGEPDPEPEPEPDPPEDP